VAVSVLAIIVAAPALAAALLLCVPERLHLTTRLVALAGAVVSLAGALVVAWQYDGHAGGMQMVADWPLMPTLGIHLRLAVDGWSVSLLLLTGIIITASVLASFTTLRRTREFFIFLLLLVSGVFGVFVAQDLLVFFLFYEVAVLPMYILIGIWGSSHAVTEAGPFRFVWKVFQIGGREYAAMKLTIMLLAGSAAILVGIFALYAAAGARTFDLEALAAVHYSRNTQLVVFPMLWIGFGTLAGVFPFHTWSPDGHASAPTAVSMLHAGVLMKLGAFGIMRVGMVLLPVGAAAWAPLVGAIAVVNIIYGAFCAMGQKDLKYIVAYSSVSHMGIVMLGAATLTPVGWNGAVFQMFAHGVMTGLLFALVGLVYERAHTRAIARMGGFGAAMPAVAGFFTLACLSSLGLPGTAGFAAELMVFLGAWQSAHPWWTIPAIAGAFVTAVYVLRASRAIFWGPDAAHPCPDLRDPRRAEWAAPVLLGGAIIVFGLWPRLLLDVIDVASGAHLQALVGLKGGLQ
jgi:NADH-quinone oxidoreductase subunit M